MERIISDISFTSGSKIAVVNSDESLVGFQSGDFVFTKNQTPVFIESISGKNITLKADAGFDALNVEATLAASNVRLREALATIQINNANWARYFNPLMSFVDTNSPAQVTLKDALGNDVPSYSAKGLNALAQNIITADIQLTPIEQRVTAAEATLTNITTTLNQKITDAATEVTKAKNEVTKAQAEVQKSKDWATKDGEIEVGLKSAKTYALEAASTLVQAEAAKTAAQLAKNQAETILDNFDDRYLGQFNTDPVTDNDGDPLNDGAIYLHTGTTPAVLRFYVSGSWLSPEQTVTASMQTTLNYRDQAKAYRDEAETFKNQTQSLAGGDAPNSLKFGGETPAQWQSKITNATVDNADKLGNKTADSWQQQLDEIETLALAGL